MGDISSRRGKISGMEAAGQYQVIRAQVPAAELHKLRHRAPVEDGRPGRSSARPCRITRRCRASRRRRSSPRRRRTSRKSRKPKPRHGCDAAASEVGWGSAYGLRPFFFRTEVTMKRMWSPWRSKYIESLQEPVRRKAGETASSPRRCKAKRDDEAPDRLARDAAASSS